MENRFFLVFEGGPRQGERVPIAVPKSTIGRKPGNTIVLADNKASGQHAEIALESGKYFLRDLGSTNGTLLDGRKIEEAPLAHGDRITIGETFFRFVDAQEEASAGEVHHVQVRAAKRGRSFLLPALLVVLVAGAGAAYFLLGSSSPGRTTPVAAVAGNLIPAFSFEADESDAASSVWQLQDGSPEAFSVGTERRSGSSGVSAFFGGAAFARASVAKPLTVQPRQKYRLAGWVFLSGEGTAGTLRAAFRSSRDPGAEEFAGIPWSVSEGGKGFERIEGEVEAPPGADRIVVSLLALGGRGKGAFDDVELVPAGSASDSLASVRDYAFRFQPADGWVHKIDSFLLRRVGLVFRDASGKPYPGALFLEGGEGPSRLVLPAEEGQSPVAGEVRVETEKKENGLRVLYRTSGLRAGLSPFLQMQAAPSYFAEAGILVLGDKSQAAFSADFSETGALGLVFGEETNRIRVRLGVPSAVTGRLSPEGLWVEIPFAETLELFFQVTFEEEKRRASDLLLEAQKAEESSRLGTALATYASILSEFPFDKKTVEKARARYDLLFRRGLERIAESEKKEEEASFFGLRDAYRQALRSADEVAKAYAGSEIAARAEAAGARIEKGLRGLQIELDREEAARLRAIAKGLESIGSQRLAAEVRHYVSSRFAEGEDKN